MDSFFFGYMCSVLGCYAGLMAGKKFSPSNMLIPHNVYI